jgi:site-specific recombinase XerD
MEKQIVVSYPQIDQQIISLVQNGLTSENSQRAYGKALTDFLSWYRESGKHELNKATVQEYKTRLIGSGLAASTINMRLSAIRKLAEEASDNALMDPNLAHGIGRVKGVKQSGVRSGNWLTRKEAQQLLDSPDISTLSGLRDRAILAIMLGCGLRRGEVANLTFEHIQQREARWVIVDIVGKGGRVRTVPMPSWCKRAVDAYDKGTGQVFKRIRRGDHSTGEPMTDQAIYYVVLEYANQCGLGVRAHDLRRTFAKLAYQGGSATEQIQLSLGHSSILTTERYLGMKQDLTDAPCDKLGLRISA